MELSENVIRELAKLSETNRAVLSAYLNLGNGFDAALEFIARESSRLELLLDPEEREYFETSLSMLQRYLNEKFDEGFSGPGLAFFADLGADFSRGVKLFVPPEPLLAVDDEAVIQPLALQLDEFEPIGVIMIDAHCTRVFVAAGQVVEKMDTFCENVHQLSKPGGWSQMRYQRRHAEEMRRLAKDAVEAAQTVFEEAGVRRIIIAGRDRMISELEHDFPKSWQDKVVGKVSWDLDSPGEQFLKKIRPILEEDERKQEQYLLERLVGEIRRHGLGTAGIEATRRALGRGQVDTLILSDRLSPGESEELVRLAETTDAHVEFILKENHVLKNLGNVGALLRYKML